jgi:uncharacterized protein YjbJ (UPF0337 family)
VKEKFEEAKGRAERKAGEVLGDRQLEREGKLDELSGNLKDKAAQLKNKVEEAVDTAKEKAKGFQERRS